MKVLMVHSFRRLDPLIVVTFLKSIGPNPLSPQPPPFMRFAGHSLWKREQIAAAMKLVADYCLALNGSKLSRRLRLS
jgi:hypothetical protein